MPTVNIYTSKEKVKPISNIFVGLREMIANELSCGDRRLIADEISLRVLVPEISLQIAITELEIIAHHYPERIDNQDRICASVKDYIQKECVNIGSVSVWLSLSELGHSF